MFIFMPVYQNYAAHAGLVEDVEAYRQFEFQDALEHLRQVRQHNPIGEDDELYQWERAHAYFRVALACLDMAELRHSRHAASWLRWVDEMLYRSHLLFNQIEIYDTVEMSVLCTVIRAVSTVRQGDCSQATQDIRSILHHIEIGLFPVCPLLRHWLMVAVAECVRPMIADSFDGRAMQLLEDVRGALLDNSEYFS